MTRSTSYGKSGKKKAKRSVLRRGERVELLKKRGLWVEGKDTRVTKLPKTLVG